MVCCKTEGHGPRITSEKEPSENMGGRKTHTNEFSQKTFQQWPFQHAEAARLRQRGLWREWRAGVGGERLLLWRGGGRGDGGLRRRAIPSLLPVRLLRHVLILVLALALVLFLYLEVMHNLIL
jgi:hypothetical protein